MMDVFATQDIRRSYAHDTPLLVLPRRARMCYKDSSLQGTSPAVLSLLKDVMKRFEDLADTTYSQIPTSLAETDFISIIKDAL